MLSEAPLPPLFKECGFCVLMMAVPWMSARDYKMMELHVRKDHGLRPYEVER